MFIAQLNSVEFISMWTHYDKASTAAFIIFAARRSYILARSWES